MLLMYKKLCVCTPCIRCLVNKCVCPVYKVFVYCILYEVVSCRLVQDTKIVELGRKHPTYEKWNLPRGDSLLVLARKCVFFPFSAVPSREGSSFIRNKYGRRSFELVFCIL